MSSLIIRKQSAKVWRHEPSDQQPFYLSKFYVSVDGLLFRVIEQGEAKRNEYNVNAITVIDEVNNVTYNPQATVEDLMLLLDGLKYPAFYKDGEIIFNPSDYDLSEFTNESPDPFVRQSELPSGGDSPLVLITENGQTGIGTKYRSENPDFYGDIGENAVDLSYSSQEGDFGATGDASHSEGENTLAEGRASHSEGRYTRALGDSSHTEGEDTEASGLTSHAEGVWNFARATGEHSGGRYGTDYTPANDGTDRIVNYGNGEDDNSPSDAFTVFRNGAMRIFRNTLANITNAMAGMFIGNSGDNNRPYYHNGTEWKGLAYVGEGGGGSATWGGISGTLSDQTDLQTALNGKLNTPTGTPDGTKFLRDDNSWQTIPSSVINNITEIPNRSFNDLQNLPTGTANRIAFFTGSNSFTTDNLLTWDNTNKRFGVGTTAPTHPISFVGDDGFRLYRSDATSAQNVRLSVFGNVSYLDLNGSLERLIFRTNSLTVSPLTVRNNGRLGVNNETPTANLDIRALGTLHTDLAFRVNNNTNTAELFSVRANGMIVLGSLASAPTGIEGAIYYDSTTKKHRGFNGTTWNDLY